MFFQGRFQSCVSQFRLIIAPFRFILTPFRSVITPFRSVITPFRSITGADPGAHPARAPLKLQKYDFFSRRIVIFHTKYPNKFRASLRSAQFFLSPPPPLLEILDPPLHCHSISVIRLGVMFVLNLFVHGSLYTLKIPCQPGSMFCEILCIGVTPSGGGSRSFTVAM